LEPRPAGRPDPLLKVLEEHGVSFDPVMRANDRVYARRTFTPADHVLLVTNAYGPHPASASLRRAPDQFPLVLLGAGALKTGSTPPGLQARDVVKAMPGTWADVQANFQFDTGKETRADAVFGIGVGPGDNVKGDAAKGLARLLVLSDVDVASDLLMQNRANAALLVDAVTWLAGDEAPAGLATSEEDQPIRHAAGDDWVWFYLPVVGVPVLMLALGLVLMARRRLPGGAS
jgi:hypothetical protein